MMAKIIERVSIAEELRYDDGGVGVEVGDTVFMGLDAADLRKLVEDAFYGGSVSQKSVGNQSGACCTKP